MLTGDWLFGSTALYLRGDLCCGNMINFEMRFYISRAIASASSAVNLWKK